MPCERGSVEERKERPANTKTSGRAQLRAPGLRTSVWFVVEFGGEAFHHALYWLHDLQTVTIAHA